MQDHYFPYPGWRISLKNSEAIRRVDDEIIKIRLLKTGELLEGWWPSIPRDKKTAMITGICLWDARWQVEFEHINKNNPPARRSLTLPPRERECYKKNHKWRTCGKNLLSAKFPYLSSSDDRLAIKKDCAV